METGSSHSDIIGYNPNSLLGLSSSLFYLLVTILLLPYLLNQVKMSQIKVAFKKKRPGHLVNLKVCLSLWVYGRAYCQPVSVNINHT